MSIKNNPKNEAPRSNLRGIKRNPPSPPTLPSPPAGGFKGFSAPASPQRTAEYSATKDNNILIVVLGPTAAGKTDFAIKLAKQFYGEIICADSRTIYQQMDIGTAKPGSREFSRINQERLRHHECSQINHEFPRITINDIAHYLIDIKRPDENFTVAEFKEQALKIIKDIQSRGKIPFLVGGTGLYISAIVHNLDIPKVAPDIKLRKKLETYSKKYGLKKLYAKLIKLDPGAKKFIDPRNPRRIIRALEICLKTGRPFSGSRKKLKSPFKILQIGINLPRQQLYLQINRRVEKMIKDGLVQEVKKLNKKYSINLPSMSGLGYRQIILYIKNEAPRSNLRGIKRNPPKPPALLRPSLPAGRRGFGGFSAPASPQRTAEYSATENKITLSEAIELIKKDTRHYAKRQLTWFKRDKNIKWISPNNIARAQRIIKKFIKNEER